MTRICGYLGRIEVTPENGEDSGLLFVSEDTPNRPLRPAQSDEQPEQASRYPMPRRRRPRPVNAVHAGQTRACVSDRALGTNT